METKKIGGEMYLSALFLSFFIVKGSDNFSENNEHEKKYKEICSLIKGKRLEGTSTEEKYNSLLKKIEGDLKIENPGTDPRCNSIIDNFINEYCFTYNGREDDFVKKLAHTRMENDEKYQNNKKVIEKQLQFGNNMRNMIRIIEMDKEIKKEKKENPFTGGLITGDLKEKQERLVKEQLKIYGYKNKNDIKKAFEGKGFNEKLIKDNEELVLNEKALKNDKKIVRKENKDKSNLGVGTNNIGLNYCNERKNIVKKNQPKNEERHVIINENNQNQNTEITNVGENNKIKEIFVNDENDDKNLKTTTDDNKNLNTTTDSDETRQDKTKNTKTNAGTSSGNKKHDSSNCCC